ncbi:MAG TPA: DUF4349 domain-containing protein, partial [Gemmatimonadales bacterium]|nr:DUF4349 domain-containing protein [Gemmatimonadales bacterium]
EGHVAPGEAAPKLAADAARPPNQAPVATQTTWPGSGVPVTSMIIRTGNASIEIDSLEVGIRQIRTLAARVGGYVANSQITAGRQQTRSATLEIRVPADRFDQLVNGLTPLGKLEYVNVSAEDVSEEFTDLDARVSNGHRLEQRLIELIATRTGKLSDVLEIERELARVREEIERMEGRMRYLKARAATSSLSVSIHEPVPVVGEQGTWSLLGEAVRVAWRNLVSFIAAAIGLFGTLLPAGLLAAGALIGVRRLWRARQVPRPVAG